MNKYKIIKLTRKITSQGKPMIKCSLLEVGSAKLFEEVAIWDGFPNFATLDMNSEVEGTVEEKQNGQYMNRTLRSPSHGQQRGNPMAGAMMEKKAAGIRESQERKEDAIRWSSCFRDATILTKEWVAKNSVPFETEKDVQDTWIRFHQWLLKQWDDTTADDVPFE